MTGERDTLDLSTEYPRSALETFAGVLMAPRTTDKCRAHLAGTLGEYIYNCGLDRQLFRFLGTDAERVRRRRAPGRRGRPGRSLRAPEGGGQVGAEIAAWDRQFLDYEPDLARDAYSGQREALARRAPGRSDITLWVHLTDIEEGRAVPSPEEVQAFRAGLARSRQTAEASPQAAPRRTRRNERPATPRGGRPATPSGPPGARQSAAPTRRRPGQQQQQAERAGRGAPSPPAWPRTTSSPKRLHRVDQAPRGRGDHRAQGGAQRRAPPPAVSTPTRIASWGETHEMTDVWLANRIAPGAAAGATAATPPPSPPPAPCRPRTPAPPAAPARPGRRPRTGRRTAPPG